MDYELNLHLNAWTRRWLPYQFMATEVGGKTVYLPVNRHYKPLGLTSMHVGNYADYLDQAVVFVGDPHKFEDIWSDPKGLYLYDEAAATRIEYFARLGRLSAKSVRTFKGGKKSAR